MNLDRVARAVMASAAAAALAAPGSLRAPAAKPRHADDAPPPFAAPNSSAEPDDAARPPAPVLRLAIPASRPAYRVTSAAKPEASSPLVRVSALAPPPPVLDIPATAPGTSSPAEVMQLADEAESSVYVAQLNEPSAALAVNLTDRVAAMQVTLPPPARLSRTEQAALLAEAPDRLDVRRGGSTIGSLAVRMAPSRAVTVELGGVLALVQAELEPAEYARLRDSAAATAFVPLETLRAAGIDLRYDPVYDEFRLAA